jgi:hypothetical protein
MMWIRGRRKKENSAVYEEAYRKYKKILDIIRSCTSMAHIESCERIVSNFNYWCYQVELPYNVHTTLIRSVKYHIKHKIPKIGLS